MTKTKTKCKCENKVPDIGWTGKCPTCDEELEFEVNVDGTKSAHLICSNIDCAGTTFGLMMTWVRAHEIRGFGQHVVRGLIELGVTSPAGLYTADEGVFSTAANSEKNGKKLYNNIQATRKMKLATFLTGLNLEGLGRTNGKRLAKEFGTLEKVMSATAEEIAAIPGVKTTAKKIREGLDRSKEMVGEISAAAEVLNFVQVGGLAGKTFCMTGLRSYNGQDLRQLIEDNGGEVKSGVSKGLDFLILKDPSSTSGKAQKARKYGTELISPDQIMEMI